MLILLKRSVHHVHLHDGMGVTDPTRHGAHMLAINQHRHSQGFNDLLDKNRDQMGGPLLVLESPRKISRDPGKLGKPQDFLVGNIADGDALALKYHMCQTISS
jgi:hypothetical protein